MKNSSKLLLLAVLPLVFSVAALAQLLPDRYPPIIVPPGPFPPFPPRPPRVTNSDLQLIEQHADVQIKSGFAHVKLAQTFLNPLDHQTEGTYLWTIPAGASISDFAMMVNGKKLNAEILKADKAREIYDGIVRSLRDPAILEFIDHDLVRVQIFPIPANGKVEVELNYSQPVTNRFSLPLHQPNRSESPKTSLDVRLDISQLKGVYSPSHKVETKTDAKGAHLTGEWNDNDRDFSLLWTRSGDRVAVDMLTYRNDEKDGFFLLLAAPDSSTNDKEIKAKDVVFVFDTSGSMEGEKIEQARRALRTLLGNLRPADRFNIVTFASEARPFRDELIPATKENLDSARAFANDIRALGGTNISDALDTAFKMTKSAAKIGDARPQQVVFLTDGQPTVGQTRLESLLDDAKKANDGARLWTFGLGFDVNTRLLDSLAEENRGASDYVLPKEDIEEKVGDLYGKIAYPILTDLKIDWAGMDVYDVYPRQLPDLFKGGQMVLMGRYRGKGDGNIALTGRIAGQSQRFAGAISDAGTEDLPRLWATRRVGFLIDDARRAGRPLEGEVRDEILSLAKKYGIVTPLNAALITEDGVVVPTGRAFLNQSSVTANRSSGGFGGFGASAAPQMRAESGKDAVMASKATKQMQEGYAQNSTETKNLGGKTFVLRDGVWVDTEYNVEKFPSPRVVKFASNEYFALAKDKTVASWLSVGESVIFVWDGKAFKVES